MVFDFTKLKSNRTNVLISPIEIFSTLPNKHQSYEYLRDVQSEVLKQWFNPTNRVNRDTIIKMNTGSGKTVLGLLILKSCIEEGFGPALFGVPDNYMIAQVINEASKLGIKTTTDPDDPLYICSKAILVQNMYSLVNSKSKFGLRSGHKDNVVIGSVIIDDVHAALGITERQFSIKISRHNDEDLFNQIVGIFEGELQRQYGKRKVNELKYQLKDWDLLVPYWALYEQKDVLEELLSVYNDRECLKFTWELFDNILPYCKIVITKYQIEITPNSIPIDVIKSFDDAKRRIFMSATLADDTPFITHFGVDINSTKIITPEFANDIGERLILVPQYINPDIDEAEIRKNVKKISEQRNVVVIVPSYLQSEKWSEYANVISSSDNIENLVYRLKTSHVGLVVFVNRYDGIDLPQAACELLVIDDLPDTHSLYDNIEQAALRNSERIANSYIQRIEQGMGRGVRSTSDYCGVVLMGKKLISKLYSENGIKYFSVSTKRQFELSSELLEQIKNADIDTIFSSLNLLFNREQAWKEAYKEAMGIIKYPQEPNTNKTEIVFHTAFNLARKRKYHEAVKVLQIYVDQLNDIKLKGWIKQQMAEYINFYDQQISQDMLLSAKDDNNACLFSVSGHRSTRSFKQYLSQAESLIKYNIKDDRSEHYYKLRTNAILDDLMFNPNSSNKFEEAVKNLGYILGFDSFRPDDLENKGPDNVWRIGNNKCLIIECKNESITHTISKDYCNQLTGSIEWFKTKYSGLITEYTPIMIHPSNVFDFHCSPRADTRVINDEKLTLLKRRVERFASDVYTNKAFGNVPELSRLLLHYKLTGNEFIQEYTTSYSVQN